MIERTFPGRLLLLAGSAVALVWLIVPLTAEAHPGPLHIHELRATVTTSRGVQSVDVRANVCVRSASEATRVTPDYLRLTQFLIYKGRWMPTRTVTEYGGWVVSLGENWGGKPCGLVEYGDVFRWPEGFAGFGSRINCVGVAFTIKVEGRTATKRVAIRCPNA